MTAKEDTMFSDVIKLLHGDRPTASDKMLYEAAIAIRDAMPNLDKFEAIEVETLLAHAVTYAGNLPSISEHAWHRVQGPWSLRRHPAAGLSTVEDVCKAIAERIKGYRQACAASEDGSAHKRLTEMVRDLTVRHPRLGLSFGYIGNCDLMGARWDDRSWKVFTKLATPDCSGACNVSFGGASTAQLGKLMQRAELELEDWCASLEARLDAGEIRIVSG